MQFQLYADITYSPTSNVHFSSVLCTQAVSALLTLLLQAFCHAAHLKAMLSLAAAVHITFQKPHLHL